MIFCFLLQTNLPNKHEGTAPLLKSSQHNFCAMLQLKFNVAHNRFWIVIYLYTWFQVQENYVYLIHSFIKYFCLFIYIIFRCKFKMALPINRALTIYTRIHKVVLNTARNREPRVQWYMLFCIFYVYCFFFY